MPWAYVQDTSKGDQSRGIVIVYGAARDNKEKKNSMIETKKDRAWHPRKQDEYVNIGGRAENENDE
jgi:hypothetical protein